MAVNFSLKNFRKEYGFIGSKSGRDVDKFVELGLRWADGSKVNAPILLDCPINLECIVVAAFTPGGGSNELFIGRVEAVHAGEEYLNGDGSIRWKDLDLI